MMRSFARVAVSLKPELQVDHEEKAWQSPFLTLLCNYVISPVVIVSRELTEEN